MTSKPWHAEIAEQLGSHHSDTMAVVRDSQNPKRRTSRRRRRQERDAILDAMVEEASEHGLYESTAEMRETR